MAYPPDPSESGDGLLPPEEYAKRVQLGPLMRAFLRTVVRERPDRPFRFLADQFRSGFPMENAIDGINTRLPQPKAIDGQPMEVEVINVSGVPFGTIISFMACKPRLQAPVS